MASGEGALEGEERQNPTKLIASLISVINIVKYFGIGVGGGALKSYKMIMAPLSLSLKLLSILGKNIILINNIIVYCLSPTDACEL